MTTSIKAFLILCAIAISFVNADEKMDIKTLTGKTYTGAKITRADPDALTIMHSGGMARVPFTDLPEEIRKKFGYDPEKAAVFKNQSAQQQMALRKRAAQIQQERQSAAQQKAHATEEKMKTDATKPRILSVAHVKNYWINTFPQPKSLDSDFHQKKKAYAQLIADIRSGSLDNAAESKALELNLNEYLRVGDTIRADQTRKSIIALEEKVHKEQLLLAEQRKAASLNAIRNELMMMESSLSRMSIDLNGIRFDY